MSKIKEVEIPGTNYKLRMKLTPIISSSIIHDEGLKVKRRLCDIEITEVQLLKISLVASTALGLLAAPLQ
jgi:hypothetical protein